MADAGTIGVAIAGLGLVLNALNFVYTTRRVKTEALRQRVAAVIDEITAYSRVTAEEMQRQGRNMFARATYMMERWREPGSPLFDLLDPVISDRRGDAPKVALLASSLRGSGALRLVDDTDDSMRTPKQARVTGTARNSLVKRINAATSIAGQWAELVGATRSSRRSGDAGIRDRLVRQRSALGAELALLIGGDDCLSSAAAVMAVGLSVMVFKRRCAAAQHNFIPVSAVFPEALRRAQDSIPKYRRPEESTYLTFMEWYQVFNPQE